MKDFRVHLKLGQTEVGFYHSAKTRGTAWREVEEMYPGCQIEYVNPINKEA